MKHERQIEPMLDEHGHPAIFAPLCRSIINARAISAAAFGSLCANPGGEMLLDLYWRESQGLKTSLTSLWLASKASEMTGRRCLAVMEELRIVERMPDPSDGRRINVRFTTEGRRKMDACFSALLLGYVEICQDCAAHYGHTGFSDEAGEVIPVPFCAAKDLFSSRSWRSHVGEATDPVGQLEGKS